MVITAARRAAAAEVRLNMAQWEELGEPLSDVVAQTVAR